MFTLLQTILLTGYGFSLPSATAPAGVFQDTEAIGALVHAYPDYLAASDKPNTVLWKDGTEMVFDDGVTKTDFENMLNHASLKDQMYMPYPHSWPEYPPAPNNSPGRARNEAFFRKMYGDSPDSVKKNLVPVEWGNGKTVQFTRINGAAEALRRVRSELNGLPGALQRYVSRPIGTFHWREISGTKRLSMHSYGTAIDFQLPPEVYRYWKWDIHKPNDVPAYPESVLRDFVLSQVVAVFERYGFIWGGKWHQYDTMHFEYRPELAGHDTIMDFAHNPVLNPEDTSTPQTPLIQSEVPVTFLPPPKPSSARYFP